MTKDEFKKLIVEALSAENIAKQGRQEYHEGHPTLTEAEIDLMVEAEKKQGFPPSNLTQAKTVLGISVLPEVTAPPAAQHGMEMTELIFCNWDYRPAVLFGGKAFAVLSPGKPWVSVDEFDVRHTAPVMTETAWRRLFVSKFGHLDVVRWRPMFQDNVPQSKPLPRAKDFDDAVRVVQAEHLAHLAANLVSKKTYDLDNSPESVENRAMLAMFAKQRARKAAKAKTAQAAANFEHAANLAHQIATAPLFLLPEIDAPSIAP